jgi:hypothetical protein
MKNSVKENNLSTYTKENFKELMQKENFEEWVDCHAGFGRISATYFIIDQIDKLTSNHLK